MPRKQQKSSSRRDSASKLGEASRDNTAKAHTVASDDSTLQPASPKTNITSTEKMTKVISSIYDLFKQTSEI